MTIPGVLRLPVLGSLTEQVVTWAFNLSIRCGLVLAEACAGSVNRTRALGVASTRSARPLPCTAVVQRPPLPRP